MIISKQAQLELDKLREHITKDTNYKIQKYCNLNSKDLWGCLCSIMDWIDVAKETLINMEMNVKEFKYIWKDMYIYISSVDIIIESITQLYSVFFEDHKNDIFNKETKVFINNPLNMSDYDYFKQIRSVFGAHPNSIKESETKPPIYKFASWPVTRELMNGTTSFDYSTFIYSSNKSENHKEFGFNIKDINKFLEKYIFYLPTIYKKIEEEKKKFINDKIKELIPCDNNINNQIEILIRENKNRYNIESIEFLLNQLKIILSVNINNESNKKKVNRFRNKIKKGVKEVHLSLQNMRIPKKYSFEKYLYPHFINEIPSFSYNFSKLSSLFFSSQFSSPFELSKTEIEKQIKHNIEIDYISAQELYVLVLVSSFFEKEK